MRKAALPLFILLSLGGGILIGTLTAPGDWYAALQKPAFNPPNWVFGPVWTILYIAIGFVGWRVWRLGESRLSALWWTQLLLNFLWSPVFFTAQALLVALSVVLALDAAILLFIAKAWRADRLSAILFIPYAAWTLFATLLNGTLWWMNS
ncbi:tryptophan-rich sensory protein [Fulvimarina endophytica]|uniref:Tryptophan-rich sensory protein n=1 Tax=Fulvimarina endophytica TaxID=2293836 RepID=A0A371X2U0_9HYPH|nr:TspO/MBR family protein [Fulvimarina endophytica]RFC63550.1 tryptophan-rich sensory protein [Fulvimarina endophytica]